MKYDACSKQSVHCSTTVPISTSTTAQSQSTSTTTNAKHVTLIIAQVPVHVQQIYEVLTFKP